jgi:hypothetical protein
MPVASPLADPPPSAAQLIEVLATLGRPVTVHSGDPVPTVLHLARLLVAVADATPSPPSWSSVPRLAAAATSTSTRRPTTPRACGPPSSS